MRLFISVNVPQEVKEKISEIQVGMPEESGNFSKVNPDNVHLTLKFLGEVSRVERVKESLDKIEFEPFKLTTSECGVFPDEQNPRVFWLGFEKNETLEKLARDVKDALPGFKDDHDFHAHATIARIRDVYDRETFLKFMDVAAPDGITFQVESFQLMTSELAPDGPVYEVVEEYTKD